MTKIQNKSAAIGAACFAASLTGAAVFTFVFVIGGVAESMIVAAGGQMPSVGITRIIVSAPPIFLFAFLASLVLTIPISTAAVFLVHPLVNALGVANRNVFALLGFGLGAAAWRSIFSAGARDVLMGSFPAALLVGGLAGLAGGVSLWRYANDPSACGALLPPDPA